MDIRAVILVPDGDEAQQQVWLRRCIRHCASRGFEVVAHARRWIDAAQMVLDGHAQVIVESYPGLVPVEVAGQAPSTPRPPRQRRPELIA